MREIIGYGGKKGDGDGGVEAPDSLHSISYAKVLDLVSEGEIQGLVNGMKSVFFNETPLQNADDTYNFQGATIDFRAGTQIQDPIDGFPDVSTEIPVGVEFRSTSPWTKAISNTLLTSISVRLGINALTKADTSNGNINGYSVAYKIELSTDGGAYQTMVDTSFSGKTTSQYQRSHRIKLPKANTGWSVRVSRSTPNANSSTVADSTTVLTYTELIDARMRYPMSALVGIQIDASQFQNIPTRAYDLYGRILQVPSNYDPTARTYSGIWDGTFKPAWTNNPAWVFYDLLTNSRYGLGNLIPSSYVDKWGLYRIAQYCDQMVPDGKGGTEPRFTCNLYLQTAAEAYKVLQDLAALFRGITYWAGGTIVAAADMPQDPTYIFTAANVIDGKFHNTGSSKKTRYTVAVVSWNDPANFYKPKAEYVQDDDGLIRYGVQQLNITAFGCTSQGQAQRAGKWALLTSRLETDVVTFSVALDALQVSPGQIVRIANPNKAGRRNGGRIHSAVGRVVTLDKAPIIAAGDKLSVMLPTGVSETKTVISVSGNDVNVSSDWSVLPQAHAVWSVDSANLVAPTYRIVSITQKDSFTYEISAIRNEQGKYAAIDTGTTIQQVPTTIQTAAPVVPANLMFSSTPYWVDDSVSAINGILSWSGNAPNYLVSWRRGDDLWMNQNVTTPSFDIKAMQPGDYSFKVVAVSSTGLKSQAATYTATVTPQLPPLPAVTGLALESAFTTNSAKLKWNSVTGATSFKMSVVANGVTVRTVTLGNSLRYEYSTADMKADGGPWRTVTFGVQAFGKFGTQSPVATISAGNPQIGPLTSIRIDPGMKSGFFKSIPPGDEDFAGLIIWISTDPTCPAIDSTKLYDGRDTFVTMSTLADGTPLVGGTTYYVRAAAYDTFGKDSLSVSAAVGFVAAGVLPDAKSISESQLTNSLAARVALVDGPASLAGSVAQQISIEVAARVGADAANANSIAAEINARQFGDAVNANNIIAEANSRATADTVINQRVDSLIATVGGNTAAIQTEQTARASADVALGVRIDSVKSTSDANTAAISNEQATRSAADSALASQINTVSANFAASGGENMYAGVDPLSVVPGAYGTYGTVIKNGTVNPYQLTPGETLTLSADLWLDAVAAAGGDTGVLYVWAQQSSGTWTVAAYISVTSQTIVRKSVSLTLPGASADMAQVSVSLYHTSKSGSSTAQAGTAYAGRIQVERGSVATAYKAGAQMLNAAVQTESTARANADNALSQQIATVTASVGNNAAAITSEQVARASADTALGLRIDSLTTTVGNTTAQIASEAGTRASADSALSSRIDTVTASTASNAAQIASEATARANGDSANATQILNLQATVGALRSDANLLPNAGFTANNGSLPDGWQLYSNDAVPISATIVSGVNGYKAVRVSWSGQNTTTKGIYLYPFFEGGFRKNTSYIFAVRARAVSLPVGATMLLSPSNYPWASFSMISNPPMTTDWQWYIGIGVRVNDTPGEYFISVSNGAGGQSNQIDICTPVIHEGSIFAGFNLGNDYQVAVNAAAIKAEQTARVTADSALSVRIDSLTAASNSNSAAITAEQVARANADSALSGRIDSVVASSSANAASILTEQSARAAADSALSQQISLVTARYSAGALNRDPLISNIANWALWTGVTPSVVAGSVAGRNAYHATSAGWMYDITPIPVNPARSYRISGRLRRSADCGKVCYIGVLLFDSAGNNISADGAWWYYPVAAMQPGVSWTDYSVLFGAGQSRQFPANAAYMSAGVILMYGAGADSGWMEAEMLRIDDSTAESAIQTEQVARAAADSVLSSQITTVQTTVNGNTASIQQQATSINGLSAQYTIKTDVNGNIAGIGLASTSVNGQPVSDVTILSDRFALVQPGVSKRVPFVVTSKNGVAQIGLDGAVVVNGSLTGDAFAFNSITGDKAQLGTFSANIFNSGIAGNNLLENSAFAATYVAGGVVKADGYSDSVNGGISPGEITVGVNLIGDDYHPAGIGGLVIRQLGTSGQGQADPYVEVVSPIVPAAAGQWVEASFYSGAYRCVAYGYLVFLDAAGNGNGSIRFADNTGVPAGRSLASFYRHALVAQAPAGTVSCRILFRKRATSPGFSDSYMMIQCPMIAAAMSGNQTAPSPWSPPGIGTQIHGGILKTETVMTQHLAAKAVSADKLASREVSAMFATIGTFRTATSGARTEISDNVIKVFDQSGAMRVKIGNLSL